MTVLPFFSRYWLSNTWSSSTVQTHVDAMEAEHLLEGRQEDEAPGLDLVRVYCVDPVTLLHPLEKFWTAIRERDRIRKDLPEEAKEPPISVLAMSLMTR